MTWWAWVIIGALIGFIVGELLPAKRADRMRSCCGANYVTPEYYIKQFIREKCIYHPSVECGAMEFHDSISEWWPENVGGRAPSRRSVAASMRRMGVQSSKKSGQYIWNRISVRDGK